MTPTISSARAHLGTLPAAVRSRATARHLLAVIQHAERIEAALNPFAVLLDGDLNAVGGGTIIAPKINVQMVKEAKSALAHTPKATVDGMAARWTQAQKERAWAIVNDIADDIDNHETRTELRQALAIYADMHYDALQARVCEESARMMEHVNRFCELVNKMENPVDNRPG